MQNVCDGDIDNFILTSQIKRKLLAETSTKPQNPCIKKMYE